VDDAESYKLNEIVGAAIKALAESGAADEIVGSFAVSHRDKVARILGFSAPEPEQPTDLLALVRQAVEDAMTKASLVPSARGRGPKKIRIYVTVAGRKTSLTLSSVEVDRLVELIGDRRTAIELIQKLADSAPSDVVNRSNWVELRMLRGATAEFAGSHRH
jgi:hypothetical protein